MKGEPFPMTSFALTLTALVLVAVASLWNAPRCEARVWEIGLPTHLQECYNRVSRADISTYVGSTFSWFCETAIKAGKANGPKQFDRQKMDYYNHLYQRSIEVIRHSAGGRRQVRGKRQAGQARCLRREYRALTDDQRNRFHDAINTLKRDTTVEPNKYDAIALLHTGLAAFTAHGGAGFPGWHRIYILMFESALREVDSSVCLPYWDSTLDSELDDAGTSNVWTTDFFGTPEGPVVEGPFAGWMTPEGSELMRNVATDGEVFTREAIEDVLSRTSHADIITSAETDPRFDIEFHHAAVHVFCGGTMGQLDTAAFDPIFFIHHSFVDYVWELFRSNMRSQGIDPNIYPDVEDVDSRHHGTADTGFGELTQADGYSDQMIESYEYEASPVCSRRFPDCGSRFLRCQPRTGRCVPVRPGSSSQQVRPNPNPNPMIPNPNPNVWGANQGWTPGSNPIVQTGFNASATASSLCASSSAKTFGRANQNDFCCDQTCDTNQWAMIPVKIVSVRPPEFTNYHSYPVRNGRVDTKHDIYAPNAYSKTERFITRRQGRPKTFQRCQNDASTGQVFVTSQGINYDGYYKEATIIDQRLAVSISMGYIAVKQPTRGPRGVTRALLRAHDACGRVCHVACRDPNTNEFKPCSGAVAISTETPRMYGNTYEEAVLDVFQYDFNDDCPRFNTDNFFITFYCDYHNEFPYAQKGHGHGHTSQGQVQGHGQGHGPARPVAVRPKPVPMSVMGGCRVTSECVLDVPCASDFRQCSVYNEVHLCRGSCRAYGQCSYGRYFLRLCPDGQYFDDVTKQCISGFCQKSAIGGKRTLSPSGHTGRGSSSGRLPHSGSSLGSLGPRPLGGGSYQDLLNNRLGGVGVGVGGGGGGDYGSNLNKNNADLTNIKNNNNAQPHRRVGSSRDHNHGAQPTLTGRPSYSDMITGFLRRVHG